MNIGDKVRLLRDNMEGVVTKFIDDKLIEIEIEDGFQIPVLKKELVVIAREESVHFEGSVSQAEEKVREVKPQVISQSGIFMAFTEINDQKVALYLINNTDLDTPYMISEKDKHNCSGLGSGVLRARSFAKIGERSTTQFEKWPALIVQMLFHKYGTFTMKAPLQKKLNFKASTFFKSKRDAPLMEVKAYLFQIDSETKALDADKLKAQMLSGTNDESSAFVGTEQPETIVDLHIDQLLDDPSSLGKSDILNYQIDFFEKQLDAAIASGMDEITFIHGAGNGILRSEIQRKLSKMKEIAFFKDAMKEKFGYGATLVKIR